MRTIFNTSFIIPPDIEQEWIHFMQKYYIGYLREHRISDDVIFTKVSIDQADGKTYSLQIIFNTPEQLEQFTDRHLSLMEDRLIGEYGNRYLCFSSTLTEI